jgi:hypothetical protein
VEWGLEPLVRQRLGMKLEIGCSQFTNPKKWLTKFRFAPILVAQLVWFERTFMFEESMKEV